MHLQQGWQEIAVVFYNFLKFLMFFWDRGFDIFQILLNWAVQYGLVCSKVATVIWGKTNCNAIFIAQILKNWTPSTCALQFQSYVKVSVTTTVVTVKQTVHQADFPLCHWCFTFDWLFKNIKDNIRKDLVIWKPLRMLAMSPTTTSFFARHLLRISFIYNWTNIYNVVVVTIYLKEK